MAREKMPRTAPAELAEIPPAKRQHLEQAQELATAQAEQTRALAMQLGYDGPLSVGALEDGIRFYQRRTVEALLETGKRLLLLKEVTPHGEFAERVEMLGIHVRSAQRFMRAAAKVAKSDTVSHLATQVKNQKAFLELVTHDDDEDIERVAELDNIDRMSASEMRAALRERDAEQAATEALLAKKNEQIDRLQRQQQRDLTLAPDGRLAQLKTAAGDAALAAEGVINGALRHALSELRDYEASQRGRADGQDVFLAGMVGQVQRQLTALREALGLPVLGTDTRPAWQQWADEQDALEAARQDGVGGGGADDKQAAH